MCRSSLNKKTVPSVSFALTLSRDPPKVTHLPDSLMHATHPTLDDLPRCLFFADVYESYHPRPV